MAWAYGYIALCLLCAALLLSDLQPIWHAFSFPIPKARSYLAILAYVASIAFLSAILPGNVYDGTKLANGSRLKYRCNGLLVTVVVVAALAAGWYCGYVPGTYIADNYAEFFVAAHVFAFLLSVYLFFKGRLTRPKNWLKKPSVIRDFVMGTELNPFVLGVNLKFFSYRPAMNGWLLVNLSFLCKQYEQLGFVTARMLLYQFVTACYICDYFVNEPMIVSTWDIIAEHFGFMLVWGDYAFIVFGFRRSVQNFFLLSDTRATSYVEAATILLLFCAGFAIFRGSNAQKHQFKTNPDKLIWGKQPVTVGGKLLASGYWGMARHLNYTGDLLIALSFCLPCGATSSLAYFYFIYLLLLTLHREKRDDERCAAKYKSVWNDYCMQVPYRMLPFVY